MKFGDDRSHSWRSGQPPDHVQGRGGEGLRGQPEVFESGITHPIHHISFRHPCPSSSDHHVPPEPAGLLVVRLMSKG